MYVVINHLKDQVVVYGSLVVLSNLEKINLHKLRYHFGRKKVTTWANVDLTIYKAPLIKGGLTQKSKKNDVHSSSLSSEQ
jgi:hypothetical protein